MSVVVVVVVVCFVQSMQNKIEETRERIRSEYDPGKACLIYVYANVGHQQYNETIRSLI